MDDFLSLLIDAEYLQQQFDAHPRDMWAFTAFVFVVGVAIGSAASRVASALMRRADTRIERMRIEAEREREERVTREKERANEERRRKRAEAFERSERAAFREEVDGESKAFVLALYDFGPRDMDLEQLSAVHEVMRDASRYISIVDMPGGVSRIELREDWLEFFERNHDLLDEVRSITEA